MQSTKLTGIHSVFHGTGQYLGKVTIDEYGHILMTDVCKISLKPSSIAPESLANYVEALTDSHIRLTGGMMIVKMSAKNQPDYERARALISLPKG